MSKKRTKKTYKLRSQTKTSRSKIARKTDIPRWVIGVFVLMIAVVGIVVVYTSQASTGNQSGRPVQTTLYCKDGVCKLTTFTGANTRTGWVKTSTKCESTKEWAFDRNKAAEQWQCLTDDLSVDPIATAEALAPTVKDTTAVTTTSTNRGIPNFQAYRDWLRTTADPYYDIPPADKSIKSLEAYEAFTRQWIIDEANWTCTKEKCTAHYGPIYPKIDFSTFRFTPVMDKGGLNVQACRVSNNPVDNVYFLVNRSSSYGSHIKDRDFRATFTYPLANDIPQNQWDRMSPEQAEWTRLNSVRVHAGKSILAQFDGQPSWNRVDQNRIYLINHYNGKDGNNPMINVFYRWTDTRPWFGGEFYEELNLRFNTLVKCTP